MKEQKDSSSTTTRREFAEQLHGENNTGLAPSDNSSIQTNEPIDNTPFRLVGNDKTGYFLGMGTYRMTENKATKEEAILELAVNQWMIIANMVTITHLQVAKQAVAAIEAEKKESK